jgi:lipoate-protein ligase A
MLRFIQRSETDPYYNLAAEEYLLKSASVDTFMIWRNDPSVIIGKHQNTLKEINASFIESNHLPIIRRITGGGTVYHDTGNVNFTFIFANRRENLIDFREFTKPVIQFLENLGLNAVLEGKNNIVVDGYKVSGNSAHLHKNKVLYHGTLLFNTDLDMLNRAITGREEAFKDKAVRSVRANVTNIKNLLAKEISVEQFVLRFRDFIFKYYENVFEDELYQEDKQAIRKLAEDKYKTYPWNFGYSPEYEYHAEWIYQDGKWAVSLLVKAGIIMQATVTGPPGYSLFLKKITKSLTEMPHEKKSLSERLKKLTFADRSEKNMANLIINKLF